MDAHSVVDDWETAPFDGGFGGLSDLEARGFSGAVEAGGTWLFFRDGDPLAVVSNLESTPRAGEIDAFEGATGQRREAPGGGAAALAAMLALDGEVRGRYFTDDTPLEAVHETLSGGGFTGYVELSENVLSGDYYLVYVDGEVDYVGFVGSSRLITGEEAEEKAHGEVGIYSVVAVDLPAVTVPEPPDPEPEPEPEPEAEPAPGGADDAPDPDVGQAESESETDDEGDVATDAEQAEERRDTGTETRTAPDADPADTAATAAAGADTDRDAGDDAVGAADPADTADAADTEPSTTGEPSGSVGSSDGVDTDTGTAGGPRSAVESGAGSIDRTDPTPEESGATGDIEAVTARTVPSLDPENSSHGGAEAQSGEERPGSGGGTAGRNGAKSERRGRTADPTSASSARAEKLEEYESRIEEYESEIDDYESEIETLRSRLEERDDRIAELEAELESLRAERDDLEARLEAAESEDGDGEAGSDADTGAVAEPISPGDALTGTSLFVRETSRGEATLEDAHGGSADREAVVSNLRIEHHTEFDADDRTVEGADFETWLHASPLYEFVEWLVTELLFEIRSTGAADTLGPLYDALPAIDRIGFGESIDVEGGSVAFDVVARDKKGDPVVIANLDEGRDATGAETIGSFVGDASDVCEAHPSLSAAVSLTSSSFESDARSAAEEATSTSLLSRDKRKSYVKLSRSSGYHLCLVESRDGSFNLWVPEL